MSEPTTGPLTFEELQLATRNRGMPLEAMRYDLTPVGLHYLLVHFDIPGADEGAWRLRVDGLLDKGFELTMNDIRSMPRRSMPVTLECAGNGRARLEPRPLSNPWLLEAIGTAEWTGTPLGPVLERVGLPADAVEILFTGADRGVQGEEEHDYQRSLTIDQAMRGEVMLVYEMNGRPLEPQHGFPLRLIVPGWYGMASVKWLRAIEVLREPFRGYQQWHAYRYRTKADDPGLPVDRIRPRALMVPPGIPDFFTRRRTVDAASVDLFGRAWSGYGLIERVEVGVDGHWLDADLDPPLGEFAWRGWRFTWPATAGEHELSCRATDALGNTQPLIQPWNYHGMGNNLVQQVTVTVR